MHRIIRSIHVKNFKSIEECKLSLNDRFEVFQGLNESSDAIEAMVVSLTPFVNGITKGNDDFLLVKDYDHKSLDKETREMKAEASASISVVGGETLDNIEWTVHRADVSQRPAYEAGDNIRKLVCATKKEREKYKFPSTEIPILPVIKWYGMDRFFESGFVSYNTSHLDKKYQLYTTFYKHSLEPNFIQKEMLELLDRLTMSFWQESQANPINKPFARFFDIMNLQLKPALELYGCDKLFLDTISSQICVMKKNGEVRLLGELSAEARNSISLFLDISLKCIFLNKEQAMSSTGIILIEYIDKYMIASKCKALIAGLKTSFPNIQFVATSLTDLG